MIDVYNIDENIEENYVNVFNSNSKEAEERVIEWVTFFRRNLEIFVEDYMGVPLFAFQKKMIHNFGIKDSLMVVASRGIGKTWAAGLGGSAICMLYPKSEVVIVASTIDQAGIIIKEKIEEDLRMKSSVLNNAIKNVQASKTGYKIEFHNGSTMSVYPASKSARGHRATFMIYEEFRIVPKDLREEIFDPMLRARPVPFRVGTKYEQIVPPEEPKQVYISSSGYKTEEIWRLAKQQIADVCNGLNSIFYSFDYSLSLYHGLKTKAQLKASKKKIDEISWLIEYCNVMYGESANAYFSLQLLKENSRLKQPFYPLSVDDTMSGIKNTSIGEKIVNEFGEEIRLISADIATSGAKDSDNTCIHYIRLIPTVNGYERQFVLNVIHHGVNPVKQTWLMKRAFYDFQADYFVLDLRNNGASIFGNLTATQYDEEVNKTYPAWTLVENDKWFVNSLGTINPLHDQVLEPYDARPVIFPISATPQLNHDIAVDFKKQLLEHKISILIDFMDAENMIAKDESTVLANKQLEMLSPYINNEEFVLETILLEKTWKNGIVSLSEPNGGTKDRYSAGSYGNYFATILERDMLKVEQNIDIEAMKRVNSNMGIRNNRLTRIMR